MKAADAQSSEPAAGVLRYASRALNLVWLTSRPLTLVFGALTLVTGLLPAVIAFVGQLIVDAVVAAFLHGESFRPALKYIAAEGLLVALVAAAQRSISLHLGR